MAKLETSLTGNFDQILDRIENGILYGSVSATLEDASDFRCSSSRCSVRVFERYSYIGSLNVVLFQGEDGKIDLSAISSGGSRAMFFKFNTFGEEAFLDKLRDLLD